MTALRSLAVGIAAFGLEAIAFGVVLSLTYTSGGVIADKFRGDLSYGARVSLSVFTLALWSLVCAAVLFGAARSGASRFRADFYYALIVAGTLSGMVLYWFLAAVSETNACLWEVGFPLGGDCWAS